MALYLVIKCSKDKSLQIQNRKGNREIKTGKKIREEEGLPGRSEQPSSSLPRSPTPQPKASPITFRPKYQQRACPHRLLTHGGQHGAVLPFSLSLAAFPCSTA
jgi:hypothetical protein